MNAYGPRKWKLGTLSGIIRRAYDICSTQEGRSSELDFIFKVFTEINGYPRYIVKNMMKKFEESNRNEDQPTESEENNDEGSDGPTLILKVPFRGQKGEALLKKLNNNLKRSLPETKYRIVHTGTKLLKYFSLKDKTKKEHMSNFIYRHKCKTKNVKTITAVKPPGEGLRGLENTREKTKSLTSSSTPVRLNIPALKTMTSKF